MPALANATLTHATTPTLATLAPTGYALALAATALTRTTLAFADTQPFPADPDSGPPAVRRPQHRPPPAPTPTSNLTPTSIELAPTLALANAALTNARRLPADSGSRPSLSGGARADRRRHQARPHWQRVRPRQLQAGPRHLHVRPRQRRPLPHRAHQIPSPSRPTSAAARVHPGNAVGAASSPAVRPDIAASNLRCAASTGGAVNPWPPPFACVGACSTRSGLTWRSSAVRSLSRRSLGLG